jgi:oxalate decarboxylase
VLASQFPSAQSPPATDVGAIQMPWSSFNNAAKRIQNGGWARQVTQADFAVSEEISGVNMRLSSGGIREMHWHLAAEWGYMTYGNCRVTVLDEMGRIYISDVKEGDIWYFPSGLPHSLQGLAPGGCEFILCFDDGKASEFNTLLLTDWIAHTPPDILALNFGVPAEAFSKIPLHNLWIFQGQVPPSLEADRAAATGAAGAPPYPFTFSLSGLKPFRQNKGGEVRIADSTNFTVSKTIAAAQVTVHPGGMRELHWHPNADEWQYWIKGKGRMGVFDTGPNVMTMDFNPGDIGYVKRSHGHYILNTGDTDLQFLEVFRASSFQNISLSDWLTHTPPELVAQTLNVDPATIAKFPKNAPALMPE